MQIWKRVDLIWVLHLLYVIVWQHRSRGIVHVLTLRLHVSISLFLLIAVINVLLGNILICVKIEQVINASHARESVYALTLVLDD